MLSLGFALIVTIAVEVIRLLRTGRCARAPRLPPEGACHTLTHEWELRHRRRTARPAADGIHCAGACTLRNVWWEDVGEDAATFRGSSPSISSLVDGGGARLASDKVFQHNGAGTVTIRNFQVERFGKLYRSCGNCGTQFQRHVVIQNVTVTAPGDAIAGVNTNFGDSATFSGITIIGDPGRDITICQKYIGNSTGDEPIENGSGADGTFCRYSSSDITYR